MFIIDRLEGDLVVLEYEGKTYTLPNRILPDEAKEGDVLRLELTVDREQTLKRLEKIRKLEEELFE